MICFTIWIVHKLSKSIFILRNMTQMHIISPDMYHSHSTDTICWMMYWVKKKKTHKLLNLPKLSSFWGCGIKPNKCWELNSTALNQAAVNSWLNVEGESLIRFSNTSPNTKAPHIHVQNVSEGRGDERVTREKLAAGRQSWLERLWGRLIGYC